MHKFSSKIYSFSTYGYIPKIGAAAEYAPAPQDVFRYAEPLSDQLLKRGEIGLSS